MNNETYYEKILRLLVGNIILYVSDIAKILGRSLVEFTEPIGFSISAVSRIRKKVKESPESALENLPYALCMLTALDTIYIFEDIDTDVRKNIEEMLLENLCEAVPFFYDKEDKPVTTRGFEVQSWFKIDYKTGKGFVYQIQSFLHEISKMKEGKELHLIEEELLHKLQEAKVAFTVMGLKNCESKFHEIKNSLETIYKKDFNKDLIYVSNVIKDEIYYDNISQDLLSHVKVCPSNSESFEKDEYVPHYIRDFVEIVNYCIEKDSYLLLFVQDEDDMRRDLSMLNKIYKDKIIFAYNRYFESVGHFKIVFDYKSNLLVMNFNDPWSKYENILGC
ncbi:hypothetical protein K2F40_15465 [Clostridium sp. CM028]|uniref:hypothetical protein n=1 Tax=Clostridium sp. CM028 TaxID=2851575 RepID=UPI001C6E6D12|nr:hypothetical protein [Clostridium sp. CM028]MBW9150357.1 hypothetical protein [Clostridium sp. CM028]WLC63534.1 hypothetical protein KTC94_17475 [Clostridium sp. CM028]